MAKLLLVEDDNNLREIYEARLQAEGYTIVSAKDGEEALVVAKAEKPDLVISDVMMPKISGFEMLDIMRNTDELKGVKVIMLTALGQSDDQDRADKLGADRYLVKSQVTLEDIVKVTHELLEGDAAPPPAAAADDKPAPAAEPVAVEPAPEPAPAEAVKEEPKPAPDASASTNAAESTAEEEADVEAKIEDFVAGASSEPTAPASAAPAPEPVVNAPTPAEKTDDKLMADAVEKLSAKTEDKAAPEPAGAAAPSAPAAPAAPAGPTSIPVSVAPPDDKADESAKPAAAGTGSMGHDKIIAPLEGSSPPKKDIKQLLADEEAKEATPAAPGATVVSDASKSDDPEDKPAGGAPGSTSAGGVDPNSIAP